MQAPIRLTFLAFSRPTVVNFPLFLCITTPVWIGPRLAALLPFREGFAELGAKDLVKIFRGWDDSVEICAVSSKYSVCEESGIPVGIELSTSSLETTSNPSVLD